MRTLRARYLLCFSLSCSCVLGSSLASAVPPAHANSDDDAVVAMARERFKEGVNYFDQKQYDKARAAFLQAYALKKHPAVLLNLAQSELRSAHEADAAKHFAAYLRESNDPGDTEKQAADAGLTAAKVAVAEVNVTVAERGAEIYVDGTLEGNSPLPGSVYLTPGSHALEAHKDGKTASAQINAIAGTHIDTKLEFAPRPPPEVAAPVGGAPEEAPMEPASPSAGRKPFFKWLVTSPVGLVGLGLTGVGLGSGIGFALASKKDYTDADSVASQITTAAGDDVMATHAPPTSTGGLCLSPSAWLTQIHYPSGAAFTDRVGQYQYACSKYQTNVHDGDTMKTVATVGFVVAGVAAVGTVVYYFIDPNAREGGGAAAHASGRSLALVTSVSSGEHGLSLMGNF